MAKPVRVLTYLHSFEPGGLERDVLRFNRAWAVQGLDVHVVLGRNEGALAAEGEGLAYTVLQQPGARSTAAYESLWMIRHLPRQVLRLKPDIVFCAGNSYTVVAVALKLALGRTCPPIVYRVSNALDRPDLPMPVRWALGLWQRIQTPVFARIVAMAEPARTEIVREMGAPPDRVVAIDNASLTRAEAERLAAQRDTTRRRHRGRRYVAIGRLAAQKNFALLLDAFAQIATPDDRLTIVGEGPLRARLEARARTLGIASRVDMPGHDNDIGKWLAAADALVLSSDYEGLGIVVIEALAAGLPVIATDCGPNMAMLVASAGRLVRPRDPAGLADAMRQVIDEGYDVAAMRRRAQAFTVEANGGKWRALFESLAQ